jgi:Kelch motif
MPHKFCSAADSSTESDLHQYDFTTRYVKADQCVLFLCINCFILKLILSFCFSQWSLVTTTGRRPKARYRATAVVFRNTMILYGGHDGTRHLSDTHIFDLENQVWSSLLTEGPCPVPRDSHIAVVHSNSMYIFGGKGNNKQEIPLVSNHLTWWNHIISLIIHRKQRDCHVRPS